MQRTCRTCTFFDRSTFEEHYPIVATHTAMGFCRRNPPVPDFARMITALSHLPRGQLPLYAVYPETCHDDWCGEWRPNAMRLTEAELQA